MLQMRKRLAYIAIGLGDGMLCEMRVGAGLEHHEGRGQIVSCATQRVCGGRRIDTRRFLQDARSSPL